MEPADGSWAVLKEIAADVLELPPEERPAFLERVCTDPLLRREVDSLIAACESATESGRFLDSPALELPSIVTTNDEAASDVTAVLRDALAGSYTIERELGRGGMATVYLARDERHGRPVALKVVHPHMAVLDSASSDGSRFQREIRIAARLAHPHILPLHDSGAVAGLLYYTMPFVDGETLRDRIVREPLPLPDTLRVLRDVARALAHAHRHGIVHRDVKPENILLNRDGDALVADFGVARALEAAAGETDESEGTPPGPASLLFGTPAYMAPEQAARTQATDHRADLYSLGVVAYELLSGTPPFRQRSRADLVMAHQQEQPAPLGSLRPELPPVLTALVSDLLAKRPADRPADADAVVRTLDQVIATPGEAVPASMPEALVARASRRRRTAWISVAALGTLLAAGFLIFRVLGIGSGATLLTAGTLSPSDALLVADFDIRGRADASLGSVIAEAVRTDLGQSKVVTIVPATRVRAALERMQRPAGAPLQSAVARELAQREGIKAVVEGDLTPLGAGFVVTVRLVSAEGNELASFQETADQQNLIRVTGQLTRRLRGKIGESLKAIRASPALQQVTTPSLAALRKYTEGVRAMRYENDPMRAATLLKEAVGLDSTFAMAWTLLAGTYRNAGMPPEFANDADQHAYRHRDHLPDRERYQAVGSHFRRGPGRDRVRAAEAYEAGLRIDTGLFANNLALLYQSRREYARAESLYRWYIARGRSSIVVSENLANALYFQGKRQEAESVAVELARRFPDAGQWERAGYFLYNRGQLDSAQRALEQMYAEGNTTQRVGASFNLSALHQVRGRLAEATRARSTSEEASLARGVPPDPMPRELRAAFVDIWHRDQPERGLRTLEAALTRTPVASLPLLSPSNEHYYLWGETYYVLVARLYARARRPGQARAVLAQFAADPRDTTLKRASAPAVHSVLGEIALAEGRPLVALEEFRRADRLPDGPVHLCAICRDADLGRAFDQAGITDSAIATFERYLETPQWVRISLDAQYRARILERLGALYEAKGNPAKAIEYYGRFAELWRNADPELQPRVAAVRRRIGSLQQREPVTHQKARSTSPPRMD